MLHTERRLREMPGPIETPPDLIPADVELQGLDGNAFVIIGAVARSLRRAGNTPAIVDAFRSGRMSPDPFDNLGKPVPPERRSNALAHIRDMVPGVKTGDAMALIDRVAYYIEKDEPYAAQRWATGGAPISIAESCPQAPVSVDPMAVRLDYCGGLRLFCALLVDPTPGAVMS